MSLCYRSNHKFSTQLYTNSSDFTPLFKPYRPISTYFTWKTFKDIIFNSQKRQAGRDRQRQMETDEDGDRQRQMETDYYFYQTNFCLQNYLILSLFFRTVWLILYNHCSFVHFVFLLLLHDIFVVTICVPCHDGNKGFTYLLTRT